MRNKNMSGEVAQFFLLSSVVLCEEIDNLDKTAAFLILSHQGNFIEKPSKTQRILQRSHSRELYHDG